MFRGLRLRLTLLYALAALSLIALLGVGSYTLLAAYFQTTTDLALQHKMAHEFRLRGLPVPPELAAADQAWYTNRTRLLPAIPGLDTTSRQTHDAREDEDDDGQEHDRISTPQEIAHEETFDGELAAVFVLTLDEHGRPLTVGDTQPPLPPDGQALASARAQGRDLRTVMLASGAHARLLTYAIARDEGYQLLQLGRTLADQERILTQLLGGLLLLGTSCSVLVGISSWLLAGRALRPAQEAWARQQTFVANASHELRTPLTLIRASGEVALRTLAPDAAESRALVGDIVAECDHTARLVEDLLLLSRLDAGQLRVDRQPVALAVMLDDITRQLGRRAATSGVRLEVAPTSAVVAGDATRLRQVFLILLDNALRHTPSGGAIAITVTAQGSHTQIAVRDTGCGIAPEHLPHLFERFYQIDPARSEHGGTGLGLAIAQGLIAAQRGHIHITSKPGAGTIVYVTMPTASA
jgi:signal transduction histidine kinase